MATDLATGLTEFDTAALRALAEQVERDQAAVNSAQARLTRSLADAERLAETLAAGQTAGVKERDMARRTVASEIAVPLKVSDRTVQRDMTWAAEVVTDYPAMLDAWETGRVGRGHVHLVVQAGAHLDPADRRRFDQRAVVVCERTTPGRSKTVLELAAQRLHPRTATERHQDARKERRVWITTLDHGMSRVCAEVPTILGEGITDRVHRIAVAIVTDRDAARTRLREARVAGVAEDDLDPSDIAAAADTRTVPQIEAEVFADLLLTGGIAADPTAGADGHGDLGGIRAHVQVVVAATTLLGADEHPADLVGAAPIDAATARELAGNCPGFDRLITHPVTGEVLATDRYTPTTDLRRRLRARDRWCRFPGCRVPAIRCEHDHTVDHALGGPTRLENLAGLCQRHHSMKQFTPWQVRQLGDGVLEWTSPAGKVYTDHPPPPAVFFTVDDGAPPPF